MFIDFSILGIILFAIMAWGANRPFLMAILSAGLLLAFTGRLVWSLRNDRFFIPYRTLFIPLSALFVLVVWQLLNPRPALDAAPVLWPYSVESYTTRLYLLLLGSFIALFYSVMRGFHSRSQISIAIYWIIGVGVLESLYGFIQQVGGYEYVWKTPTLGVGAQGTLMNHNHFALLLNMSICTGVGFLYRRTLELLRGQILGIRNFLNMSELPRLFIILLWIGFIGLGVFLSLSRTGIFAMFAALGSMLLALGCSGKRKHAVSIMIAVLLVVFGLGLYSGMGDAFDRYASLARNWQFEESRGTLWKDAWPMIATSPLFGTGLGSFKWTYPAYESLNPDIPAVYAHNDYLQLIIEIGFIGFGLVLWAFVICLKTALKNLKSGDPLTRSIGLAAIGALVAVAIQEFVDYSLFIPGVAAMLVLLISLNEKVASLEKRGDLQAGDVKSISC